MKRTVRGFVLLDNDLMDKSEHCSSSGAGNLIYKQTKINIKIY